MANDTLDLVDRIRAAGFTCEISPGSGHWTVTDPDGRHMGSFSTTPGSTRSLRNAISDIRKTTGVDFSVQRRTPRKEDRPVPTAPDPRKAALLADRNRNEKALAEAERRAAEMSVPASVAALKATLESPERQQQPGAPAFTKAELDRQALDDAVAVTLSQQPGASNKKYPVLQPPRMVTFTPAEMREALEVSVCNTRPVQTSIVEKYRTRMRKGQWRITHQGVAIDWHGCVLDGRQRMKAAIAEDMDLTIYVTYGMDPSTFFAMDDGKNRTSADAISMADLHWFTTTEDGKRKELKPTRTALAAAVALCLNLDYRNPDGTMKPRYELELNLYSREDLVNGLRVLDEDGTSEEGPYFDLGYYTSHAGDLRRHAHMTMTAAYVAMFMAHRAHPGGPHGIWHNQLITGANLAAKSPALKLIKALANQATNGRRANSRGGMTSLGQYAIYTKAWNAFLAGKNVDQLKWREDEEVPMPYNPYAAAPSRRRT